MPPATRAATPAATTKNNNNSRRLAALRDPKTEAWLDSMGVEWELVESVRLDDFDLEKSLKNQARVFEQLNEHTVEQYAEAMGRGERFPALVAHRKPRQRLVNIDGNHRSHSAVRAGMEIWPWGVYEVVADAKTVAVLTMQANVKHGLPSTEADRVHQAIWLMNNGASKKEAATTLHVAERLIARAWSKIKAEERVEDAHILRSEWDRLTSGVQDRLLSIPTDEALKAGVSLALRAGLTSTEAQQIVTEVNGSKSAAKQLQAIKDFESVYAERIQSNAGGTLARGNSRRRRSPRQMFASALTSINQMEENDLDRLVEAYAPGERAEAAIKAYESAERINRLAKLLEDGAD